MGGTPFLASSPKTFRRGLNAGLPGSASGGDVGHAGQITAFKTVIMPTHRCQRPARGAVGTDVTLAQKWSPEMPGSPKPANALTGF